MRFDCLHFASEHMALTSRSQGTTLNGILENLKKKIEFSTYSRSKLDVCSTACVSALTLGRPFILLPLLKWVCSNSDMWAQHLFNDTKKIYLVTLSKV